MRSCVWLAVSLLLAFPVKALDPQKSMSQFTHAFWTAKDGIPGPVRAIAQTPDGYLWLGTEAGLYRFDGLRFVAWEPGFGESIPNSSVLSLCTSRDGSLWIGFGSSQVGQLRDGFSLREIGELIHLRERKVDACESPALPRSELDG